MNPILWTAYLVLAAAAVGQAILLGLQAWEQRRYVRSCMRTLDQRRPSGRALVLAPCKGADAELEANLRALFRQDYGDYEIALIVEDAADAAAPIIRRVIAEHPTVAARLIVAGRAETSGQKVHNIRAATADLAAEIRALVFVDSDARPRRQWLRLAVARLAEPGVAAATGYRWFVPKRPSLANGLLYSVNATIMSLFSRDNQYMVWGGSWAIRREIFDSVGLHRAWEGTLSDDLVASRELRRAKCRVRFEPACVNASPLDASLPEAISFLRRQYLITRHYTPGWWLAAVFAATFRTAVFLGTLAAIAWGMWNGRPPVLIPLAAGAVVYGLVAARRRFIQDLAGVYFPERIASLRAFARLDVWAHPLVGLAEWLALVGTIFGSCVRWRGICYRLLPRGRIALIGREDENENATIVHEESTMQPSVSPVSAPAVLPSRPPRVVLWDTRKLDVSKDFAGGFGIGQYCGDGSFRSRVIRHFYKRDRRPSSLLYAYLAAIFAKLGYRVEYAEDNLPADADLYVFNPSLLTLPLEREAIAALHKRQPRARVLVVGTLASVKPDLFADLDVTVVKGEAEQLLWKLDEALNRPGAIVQLGTLEDLDRLPMPDWSPFQPERFRIGYDFTRFPTGLVQSSRGCALKCDYCPYIVLENSTRVRNPEAVADEMAHGIRRWGFRSFKFRDPLFGLRRAAVFELAERIGRLPRKIQFSIETRIDLLPAETLRALRRVGLTSITVGVETPDDGQLRRYLRAPIREDRQREFIDLCRRLGIRNVCGFLIGFPEDTEESIQRVRLYAEKLNPTYANFNVVTPYPGTAFYERMKPQIDDADLSHYTVYTPVLKYQNLTRQRMEQLVAKCFHRYYFRWPYLRENAPLLWPMLRKLGFGRREIRVDSAPESKPVVPPAHIGAEDARGQQIRADGPHRSGKG